MSGKVVIVVVIVAILSICSAKDIRQTQTERDWYEKAIFYQIYPRSFMDSDGNGVGDLKGITSKLEHLADLGVTGTWLSPIFTSPMKDFGYDIANFTEVDPIFGTLDDLKDLFAKAKELGIKIILDFVPNHSSNACKWFEWSENRENGYDDWYVWADPKGFVDGVPQPPTNWVSVFYGSAWTYSEKRQQFYLHQFDASQPDLNFRNPVVVEEMKNVLRYWLEMGADGFRVDAINHLFEVEELQDEEVQEGATDPLDYGYLHHILTKDLPETYEMIYDWRDFLDEWHTANGGDTKIMMTEAWVDPEQTMRYYQRTDGSRQGSHMPFNFVLITDLWDDSKPSDFKRVIDDRLHIIPEGKVANWVLGNHDKNRVGSRYGAEMVSGMLALEMGLPGIAVTYYGEEIGMLDNKDITWEQTKDPQACNRNNPDELEQFSRDPERTPMQWDATTNTGFTTGTPWLPVHSNYVTLNLAVQKSSEFSTYQFYKKLVTLRQTDTLIYGAYESKVMANDNVFAYRRTKVSENDDNYLFIINFSSAEYTLDLTESFDNVKETVGHLAATSTARVQPGTTINPEALPVGPHDVIILRSGSSQLLVSAILIFGVVARFFLLA
ncbi:maltase 1-like [Sergentomyia squamirostris]